MRILVTGATGFVGSRLLERLAEIGGHDLYSLQRYVTGRYVLGADRGVKVVFCDLRDQFAVKCAVREVQPEVVFHLASISPVSYSYDHPNEVMDANLCGTINLAESCLREVPHFKHFLFASTSETFGNGPVPKREDTPQAPNSPYSVSKHAAEKYVLYMWDAYKFPVTVLRPFNTYGRRDNTHFLVERMLVQMLRGDIVKLGDPTPERDLLYIDDHVDAYLTCFGEAASEHRADYSTSVLARGSPCARLRIRCARSPVLQRPNPLGYDSAPAARHSGALRRLRQRQNRCSAGTRKSV